MRWGKRSGAFCMHSACQSKLPGVPPPELPAPAARYVTPELHAVQNPAPASRTASHTQAGPQPPSLLHHCVASQVPSQSLTSPSPCQSNGFLPWRWSFWRSRVLGFLPQGCPAFTSRGPQGPRPPRGGAVRPEPAEFCQEWGGSKGDPKSTARSEGRLSPSGLPPATTSLCPFPTQMSPHRPPLLGCPFYSSCPIQCPGQVPGSWSLAPRCSPPCPLPLPRPTQSPAAAAWMLSSLTSLAPRLPRTFR